MKKLLFIISFVCLAGLVSAQNTLTFAYDVDDNGNSSSDNSKFALRDGGEIKMLVKNPKEFNTTQLQYKIYKMNCYGDKTYDNTFNQDIKTTWIWAYKGIILHSSGYYYIEVLNSYGKHLCDGIFYATVD